MNITIDQFRQDMTAALGYAPDDIQGDGAIHRFSPTGRGSDKPAWYMLHLDGVPAGAFGDWRSGLQSTWCAKPDNDMTAVELADNRQRAKAMMVQREADKLATQQMASETALQRWNAATPCTAHPYLTAKGVQGHGVKVEADGFLIVPMWDAAGKLWNIERINPVDFKDKRGLYGGRRTGLYHSIGPKPEGRLVIAEGYATGASIHDATGWPVAVAFNAGNLEPVALALRAQFPTLQIIMAADDDHLKDGNPGMSKAMAAALAVGGLVAVPSFPADRPDKATDFNDLHQLAGLEAVKACMDSAIESVSLQAGTASITGQIDLWPEPTPLPNALPPVEAFSFSLLPDAFRPWVADIAERMQCPPDFLAVGVMVAASALVGARVQMQPKARDDWRVTPNLWGLCRGQAGGHEKPGLERSAQATQAH